MNFAFLSLNGQDCIQDWPQNSLSLYYTLKAEHSISWIGKKQYTEVAKFHQTIYGEEKDFTPTDYPRLLGKLLSDIINQSCYDLVVCCDEIFHLKKFLADIHKNINVYIPVYVINM